MASNGANPFLFEEAAPEETQAVSNPFLMDEDFLYGNSCPNDNPFLSQTAATMASSSTNPFAFDPMDLGPAEAEPATDYDHGIIGTIETTMSVSPQKPTDLNLTFTNTVSSSKDPFAANFPNEDNINSKGKQAMGPSRPPPPSSTSTSKETQDLLMSVMGAMDATSTHLLDRIPPTRTPSPVSMKDLHSQCPTPEPTTYEDLLDMDDSKMQHSGSSSRKDSMFQSDDLLSLGDDSRSDVNKNQVVSDRSSTGNQQQTQPKPKPPRPEPPKKQVPPPKPPPPSKPPPPTFLSQSVTPPIESEQKPAQKETEMIDMLGDDNIEMQQIPKPQKPMASKEDILNLYNKASVPTQHSQQEIQPIDLLSDVMEMDTKSDSGQEQNIEELSITQPPDATPAVDFTMSGTTEDMVQPFVMVEQTDNKTTEPNDAQVFQENFISPERSASDLQMDASDSHSRGSISSTTFNPFMATEDNTPTPLKNEQPVITAEYPPSNTFDAVPGIEEQKTNETYDAFVQDKGVEDEFDAFAAKFESVAKDENKNGAFDAFSGTSNAWGNVNEFGTTADGFENEEPFDSFLTLQEPPQVPQSTPNRMSKAPSQDSEDEKDFSVFIKPKNEEGTVDAEMMPTIAPPPTNLHNAFTEGSPRFNPFDQQTVPTDFVTQEPTLSFEEAKVKRTDSEETPPTPLFDEDVSQPLEPYPRTTYTGDGWEMHLRQPNKKKITGQRFWKKIFVTLTNQNDCVLLQLYNQKGDKDPFQELPLQPCYSVSEIGAQQYDQYGKIFTIKLQYIFYKERPGVRPGQAKKAERLTNKLSQFASYAIQGDYQGVKEFGSDLRKLGLPVEHAPQVSQLMKLGSLNYGDLKQFSASIEEALFRLQAHRDRALHYKMEEVQITCVDELYVDQDADGHIEKQIARVRLFFLGFLTGMPDIELGVNDLRRQGKEVVGRHDIIPVITEEWIRLEEVEFHSCVQQDEYQKSHIIKFKPPDACYIELMRFRIRPPKNRELPLQLKASINITGSKVTLKADVLVPGFASRKLGQVPCEDVMIRYPIPECWIYLFRVEKHFRYGSVKSAHRRTGKIKGIERILGTVENLQENLIEVTSGQAKYEHQHRSVVWRCPRLPKEGQGAYTTHNMVCHLALTSFDQIPEQLPDFCYVEFTMPATQVSHTTVRSVSLQNTDSDEPPEKYVRYLARHEYKVGIEHTEGEMQAAYEVATAVKSIPVVQEEPAPTNHDESDSDDSD